MESFKTGRMSIRFIPHRYEDGTGWLGIESTDGNVLPGFEDTFFRLDLKGFDFEEAKHLAALLNDRVGAIGASRAQRLAQILAFAR